MSNPIPVGVQLYSVRDLCAKDMPGTLALVKSLGYNAVEFAGYYDHAAYDLRKMLDDTGLTCCGTHIGMDKLTGDNLRRTIDFHHILGCNYLIVPWMPKDKRDSVVAIAQTARWFNELTETLAPEGMQTGYHAHGDDFNKVSARSAWDILFASTVTDVIMQMDTGNAAGGGADPLAILKLFPGRAHSVHLKEFGGPKDATIGQGTLPWNDILSFCRTQGGTKCFVVEYECESLNLPDALRRSREFLHGLGL